VTAQRVFPVINYKKAISISDEMTGPSFGKAELAASSKPFNEEDACCSFVNEEAFMIPIEEDESCTTVNNALTRTKEEFTITDLEVWEFKNSDDFKSDQYLERMKQYIKRNIETYGSNMVWKEKVEKKLAMLSKKDL
jgi:hypothetical protein